MNQFSNYQNIKAIIFDLGGVILNIDPSKTIEAFTQLGFEDAHLYMNRYKHSGIFGNLEEGKISEDEFYDAICEIANIQIDTTELRNAWNALLLDIPTKRLEILESLQQQMPIFMLSNTNAIHIDACFGIDYKHYTRLDQLFTKTYLSYETGISKPHPEAYQMILNEFNIHPNETLFLDDSLDNIKSAQQIGLQTALIDPKLGLEQIF